MRKYIFAIAAMLLTLLACAQESADKQVAKKTATKKTVVVKKQAANKKATTTTTTKTSVAAVSPKAVDKPETTSKEVATTPNTDGSANIDARKVLDKTASVIGNNSGATANFTMSGKYGNSSGSVSIKGNKFAARTNEAIVWFDGKTQWTYVKDNEEVNISHPSDVERQAMNPYQFVNLYKKGFNLAMKTQGNNYQVHLTAQNKKSAIQEMYILINKATYNPSQVKVLQSNGWTTININNFRKTNLADGSFRFNAKDYPNAEIIDLR